MVAYTARAVRLSPNRVSVPAALAGMAGGALLYEPRLAIAGFGLLVLHGFIDSADGQLARMTNQTSEIGRALEGVSGRTTYAQIAVNDVANRAVAPAGEPIRLAACSGFWPCTRGFSGGDDSRH